MTKTAFAILGRLRVKRGGPVTENSQICVAAAQKHILAAKFFTDASKAFDAGNDKIGYEHLKSARITLGD